MVKIGICGHFGIGYELLNGQTIKTKYITGELEELYGKEQILFVDTHGGLKKILKLSVQTFHMFERCTNVLFVPARHALLFFAPLFSLYNVVFRRSLHYIVVGGWLPQFLEKHRWLSPLLKRMSGVYVQTVFLQEALQSKGFQNVHVLRNFKRARPIKAEELVYTWAPPFPLCTFSRIMKEKGIEDAIEAVLLANKKLGGQVFRLDIYGVAEPDYRARWEALQKAFPEAIRYGSPVAMDRSAEVVKNYYALLFPTYYFGEGFPGTLIDAMNAGVPAVVSDLNNVREIVAHGSTGVLLPPHEPERWADILVRIAEDPAWWNGMKRTSLEAAKQYAPEQMIKVLTEKLI